MLQRPYYKSAAFCIVNQQRYGTFWCETELTLINKTWNGLWGEFATAQSFCVVQ